MNLLADTNIFGIAVDPKDKRRKSVWKTLGKVASEKMELNVAEITIEEIKENPHQPTKEKELKLLKLLITNTYSINPEIKNLSRRLETHTTLEPIDAQIVATAIINNQTFWSGDYYILREKTINQIKQILKQTNYTFKYKKE